MHFRQRKCNTFSGKGKFGYLFGRNARLIPFRKKKHLVSEFVAILIVVPLRTKTNFFYWFGGNLRVNHPRTKSIWLLTWRKRNTIPQITIWLYIMRQRKEKCKILKKLLIDLGGKTFVIHSWTKKYLVIDLQATKLLYLLWQRRMWLLIWGKPKSNTTKRIFLLIWKQRKCNTSSDKEVFRFWFGATQV